jgi:hypothetical protein
MCGRGPNREPIFPDSVKIGVKPKVWKLDFIWRSSAAPNSGAGSHGSPGRGPTCDLVAG